MSRLLGKSVTATASAILTTAALGFVIDVTHCVAGGCRRRACCEPALPVYAYQSAVSPLRGSLASYPADSVAMASDSQASTKIFRPLANTLVVGDCTLEDARLMVDSAGRTVLSFRLQVEAHTAEPAQKAEALKQGVARKDARPSRTAGGGPSPSAPIVPVRHHRIQVRAGLFTGGGPVPGTDRSRATGVLLTKVSSEIFHVNAGEHVTQTFQGDSLTRRQFDDANQAEFELIVDPPIAVLEAKKVSIECRSR